MSPAFPEPTAEDPAAVPGMAPEPPPPADPGRVITVRGERFRVRRRDGDGPPYVHDYDWLSGPNPGYGLAVSGPLEPDDDDHRARIEDFLDGIDPATGYLAD